MVDDRVVPIRLRRRLSRRCLILLRPQRRGASGDRERDIGRVEVLARAEVEPRLGRIGGQHAVESPARDHNSRPAAVRRVPTPSAHDRIDNRKNAANGSAHIVVGKPQRKKPQHHQDERDRVGGAHPHFLLALDHQAVVERPLLDGLGHVGLGLVRASRRTSRSVLASNSVPGLITLSADTDRDADRIDVGPGAGLGRSRGCSTACR